MPPCITCRHCLLPDVVTVWCKIYTIAGEDRIPHFNFYNCLLSIRLDKINVPTVARLENSVSRMLINDNTRSTVSYARKQILARNMLV